MVDEILNKPIHYKHPFKNIAMLSSKWDKSLRAKKKKEEGIAGTYMCQERSKHKNRTRGGRGGKYPWLTVWALELAKR